MKPLHVVVVYPIFAVGVLLALCIQLGMTISDQRAQIQHLEQAVVRVEADASVRVADAEAELFCPTPACAAPTLGELQMNEDLMAHRREIIEADLYAQGAADMLDIVRSGEQIEIHPDGPWRPGWREGELELLFGDTSLLGWQSALENWTMCCDIVRDVWPRAYPDESRRAFEGSYPDNYPDLCY